MKDNQSIQKTNDKLIFNPHTGGGSFSVSVSGKPVTLRVLTGHIEGYIFSNDDINRVYFVVDPDDPVDNFAQTGIYQFAILNEFGKTMELVGWQWVEAIRTNSELQEDGSYLVKASDLRGMEELMQILDDKNE